MGCYEVIAKNGGEMGTSLHSRPRDATWDHYPTDSHQPADLGVAVPRSGQHQDPGPLRQARRNRRRLATGHYFFAGPK